MVQKADTPPLTGFYDTVLANINKNIILANMTLLAGLLPQGGRLLLSGLLEADGPEILAATAEYNLLCQKNLLKNGWIALSLINMEV